MTTAGSRRRPRVLVIYKKSTYQIYVQERRNERVLELLHAGDASVARLEHAHHEHTESLREARRALKELGTRAEFRYRSGPASSRDYDLVLTLGGDGTLLFASQAVGPSCPVIAINTAPEDSVGYFCAGTRAELRTLLEDAIAGRLSETRLTRMQVEVDGEVISRRVLNDALFTHVCPAATTRYTLVLGEAAEEHKSSGVWVATAAGSTAAIRSAGGKRQPITSRRLQFLVREPYASATSVPTITRGFLAPDQRLELRSLIRQGHLYLDGPHLAREIEIGSRLVFARSDEPMTLLGFEGR